MNSVPGQYCTGWSRSTKCPRRDTCRRYQEGKQVEAYRPVSVMQMPDGADCPSYKPVIFSPKRS